MMKSNRWRILAAVVATAVLMAACGSREEPKAEDERKTREEPVEVPEETTKEEAGAEKEPEEAEESVEEPAEWVTAYREFLSDRENLVPLLLESGEGGMRGYITGFYLHDLNGDEVPELFVQKDVVADYIYTYVDSHMELRNAIAYDAFGEAYFGFDARDGQAYRFELDAGTGTERTTSMSKVTLKETSHDMGKPVGSSSITYDEGLEVVCSASFGDMEQADGTYESVEWEDAVFSDGQFKDLALNFAPFDFHEITDRNIETYITMEYGDMAEECSQEDYREKMRERREAFQNARFLCEVKNGEYVIPETVARTEEFTGIVYYDTDLLACFREEDLRPKYEGDWKQVYKEWLENIGTATDNDGNPVLAELDYPSICLYDWDRTEAPVLEIDNGMIPWTRNYFAVLDGEVVNIGAAYRHPLGASMSIFINSKDYYFEYYSIVIGEGEYFYAGSLYQIKHDQPELIGSIEWQQVEYYNEEYVLEYGVDNPNCLFYGEQVSKQEFMSEVDKLLGNGATAQLLEILSTESFEPNEIEGPLSFAEPLFNEGFTPEQIIDVMDTL